VLLSDGLAPAVIDMSPYWRPTAYAEAVVVVDALLWRRADSMLVDLGRPKSLDDRVWTSLLARAGVDPADLLKLVASAVRRDVVSWSNIDKQREVGLRHATTVEVDGNWDALAAFGHQHPCAISQDHRWCPGTMS
jgi:hypothetical protein